MKNILLIAGVTVLLIVNIIFFIKFVYLQKSIVELKKEYETYSASGDTLKSRLMRLSVLNDISKKVTSKLNKNIVDLIYKKAQEFQIPPLTYSEKDEKFENDLKLKVLQFKFNKVEINKLFAFLIGCEKDIPAIKVKAMDISVKDKKIADSVTVEFIKTITLDSQKN